MSDRTLQLAGRVAAGEASAEELVPVAEQLVAAATQSRERFREDSHENPEIAAEDAARVLQAMDGYLRELDQLLSLAREGRTSELTVPLNRARESLAVVRQEQARHATACHNGPAMHPYLNRLLAHLDFLAGGGAGRRHTRALLEDFPAFLEEVSEQVSGIEDPGLLERSQAALADLQGLVDSLPSQLDHTASDGFAGVRETVMTCSDRLAEGLGIQFEMDLSVGRTPYAPVNLVLAASDRILTGQIRPEQFKEAVSRCQWLVSDRFAHSSDESVLEAVAEVQACLARLLVLGEAPDPEQVVAEREALRSATENLAMFVAVLSSDDEVLDVIHGEGLAPGEGGGSRGLPLMLSSLLQVGDRFLEGQASRQDLEEGMQLLEGTISRTQSQVGSVKEGSARSQLLATALAKLKAAADNMRDLADRKGGRGALERAEAEMHAAQEALRALESAPA